MGLAELTGEYKVIFNNLSLSIKKGTFTTILGNNGCGKSTLVRLLSGLDNSNGSISIDGVILDSYTLSSVRRKIGVVFENPDNSLISKMFILVRFRFVIFTLIFLEIKSQKELQVFSL